MQVEFSEKNLTEISSDAAIVFTFSENNDEEKKITYIPSEGFLKIDSLTAGQIQKTAKLENFTGKKNEMLSVIPQANIVPSRIVILGLGERKNFTQNVFREVMSSFAKKMKIRIDSASLVLPTKDEVGIAEEDLLHVLVEGLLLGQYVFIKYKREEKKDRDFATVIVGEHTENASANNIVETAKLYCAATILARDLVNEPPTIATPEYLANLAEDIAKENPQLSCTVYDKKQIREKGMEAFLGIARAADIPPKFIHLEYTPKETTKEKVALVGKGITFDTGGINVKSNGGNMHIMKMDMAGAAAVLGVFSVLTKLQPKVSIIGLIAATPNLVSSASIVPGDVVKAMNGKTIEILNTDAEGRVTLADSLSYAVREGATHIIDIATLTGSCWIALGKDISALFSNNTELRDSVKAAAEAEGEKVWEMPLEKEYKSLNKSEVADIANLASSRYGGTITAALFLEEFVDGKPWVHLDIAGPAFSEKGNSFGPKGGTGFGVRTMLKFLMSSRPKR